MCNKNLFHETLKTDIYVSFTLHASRFTLHALTPILCLTSLLFHLDIKAQPINNQIKDVVMPSPNAASLGKYGDIPVSYYTGVPNIGIPIHTLTEGALSLPISLSYHTGGVKVGEPASWVGLGWSLSAGGMISRTVQGKPDERAGGYFSTGANLKVQKNISHTITVNGVQQSADFDCIGGALNTSDPTAITNTEITGGLKDGEPDIFSFSIGGYSGKFYIDAGTIVNGNLVKGTAVLIPKQDVKIDYYYNPTNLSDKTLAKFTVTTPNGIKYDFGSIDTIGTDADDAIELTNLNKSANTLSYATSWYLKRITSADGVNTITLNYTQEEYSYGYRPSGNSSGYQSTTSNNYSENLIDVTGYRLNYIQTSTEKVTFVPGANRKDLDKNSVTFGYAKQLDRIKIENGTYCKDFILDQSYFLDYVTSTALQAGGYRDYRLRLNSVQEKDCNANIALPAHTFTYHGQTDTSTFLPNRYSSAIDHWGYYNAATTNPKTGFNIPHTILTPYSNNGTLISPDFGSSNRETDEEKMKWGTIKQITYPTGGNTIFDFEANTYYDTDATLQLVPETAMNLAMPHGNCFSETSNITPSITVNDIEKAYFTLNHRRATYYGVGSCTEGSYITLKLYSASNNYASPICSTSVSPNQSIKIETQSPIYRDYDFLSLTKKLKDVFPCITNGGVYKVEIVGKTAAAEFTFLRSQVVVNNTNRKVGGLRIKKITSSDGVNTAKDVIKTYNYDGVTSGQSSGVLYNKPLYGYVFSGYIGTCANYPTWPITPNPIFYINHFWMDNSIVPLGSFEGNHIAYSSVKEYYNTAGTGYHTKYLYTNEPATMIMGLPIEPLQPRIGSGELSEKYQKNDANQDVASEKYFPKNDACDYSAGTCIKINTYYPGGINNGGTQTNPITFWKDYKIRTRPYRLESIVTMQNDVTTTTSYTYDNALLPYLPKRSETVTNSNGVATTTTYYYPSELGVTQLSTKNMIFPVKVKQVTGSATKWTKVEYDASARPIYLKECLNNADETNAANWITRLYIESYTTNGMPQKIWRNNALAYEYYTWNNKLLTKKELIGGASGTLTWDLEYITGTSLVNQITDENRLIKKFSYDPLMRLLQLKDRMKPDGTDVQTTTDYTYQYGAASVGSFVQTSTSFAGGSTPLVSRQIMDGLGRTKMSMRIGYTPANQNLKSLVTYDAQGRVDLSYQPYESTTTALDASPTSGTLSVQTLYESSPLSRPIKQIAEDGKFVESRYGNNTGYFVRKFSVVSNGDGTNVVSAAGSYGNDLLYRTTVLNENWNNNTDNNIGRTDIFKDKLGRVLLTRKYVKDANNAYQNVDTYNVYDYFGQLVMVIPPDATSATDQNGSINLSLVFEYNYDTRNRLTKKKVPNADWLNFYYNDRDQLTLTQDGNMRTSAYGGNANKYLGTQYNNLGQVVKTGWVSTTTPLSTALSVTIADADKLTENQYFANRTWVKHQAAKVLKPTGVSTIRDFVWSYIERRVGYEYTGNPIWTGKQHLLSQTYRYGSPQAEGPVDDDDNYGVDWYVSGYDGLQKPTLTLHYLFSGYSATEVRSYETYTYDNGQRLTNAKHMYTLNGAGVSVPTFTLSNMVYNFKDQLTRKNIANVNGKYLQSVDYGYNGRGWLTNIGSVNETGNDYPIFDVNADYYAYGSGTYPMSFSLPSPKSGEDNPDLFTESIIYEAPNTIPGMQASQYNGNISQIVWQIAGREKQAYSFRYDNLDRLTEANYADIHNSTYASHGWTSEFKSDNKYQEKVSYDLRGNIQSLQRNGLTQHQNTYNGFLAGLFGQIDNLTYTYDATDKNKLLKVADASSLSLGFTSVNNTASTHYAYDANGNLISDVNKGITAITYNYLNLPLEITFTGNRKLQFVYDASGAKLRKIANNNGTVTTYDYVNGVEYTNNTLERIPHTEGEIVKDGSGNYVYEYTLKDHLGNTRVTFGDADNNGVVENSDIKQINHYYPFGLNMEGPGFGVQGVNKYQFGEKELNTDFGLNWSDFGARWYQSDVPHFLNVDPMAEMYSSMSPYHYGKNSPMVYADPTGMMSEAYSFGMSGSRGSAHDMYQRDAAISQSATGKARDVNEDDIKETHTPNWEATRVEDSQGNIMSDNCDCGCPGKPPCKGQTNVKMKLGRNGETAPLRTPYTGFWGNLDYFFNGGNENGYKYDKNGYPIFYAPMMGMPALPSIPNLGLITTGRTVAKSLEESLVMKEIMSNPKLGEMAMRVLKDPRLVGWSKMQYTKTLSNGQKIVIHYVAKFENSVMKAVDDFKFK